MTSRARHTWLLPALLVAAMTPTVGAPAANGDTAGTPPTPVVLDDDAVSSARRQLSDVQADPRFSRWQRRRPTGSDLGDTSGVNPNDLNDGVGSAFLRNLGESIGDFFRWLFRPSGNRNAAPSTGSGTGGAAAPFAWDTLLKALGWAVLVATGAGLIYALWAHRRGTRRTATAPVTREKLDAALAAGDALAANAPAWSRHARELLSEGDPRLAYRAVYLALLAGLHRHGRIRYRRQRTNFTYVAGYRGPDAQRERFAGLTTAFDDCWYGHRTPDPTQFTELESETSSLLRDAEPTADGDAA